MREFDGGRKDNYPTAHKDEVARDQWNMVVKRLRRTGGWSFDDQPHLLGLPSGRVVDLRTGVPRDAVKKDRVIMTVAKTPEEADTPHFDRFLDQVTCGRQDLADYLWRLMGYTLTGGREEIAILLKGEGANGKGTLIKGTLIGVLMDILGDYGAMPQPDFFKKSAENRHQAEMAVLDRKRLWVNPESADGAWVVQRFQVLTGEKSTTANKMRQDPMRIALDGTLWVGCNKTPTLDGGRAMARRLRVIPCDMRLKDSQIDPRVKNELLPAEYPAILWRMTQEAKAYLSDGLLPAPECVVEESREFLINSAQPLDAWLDERVDDSDPTAEVTFADLFTDTTDWFEEGGYTWKPTKQKLAKFLVAERPAETRAREPAAVDWP